VGAVSTVLDALAKADAKKPEPGGSSLPPAGGPPPPSRSRFWRILGLLLLLVSGFFIGLFSEEEEENAPVEVAVTSPAPKSGSATVPIKPASLDDAAPDAGPRVALAPLTGVAAGDAGKAPPVAGTGAANSPGSDDRAAKEEPARIRKPLDSAAKAERSRWRESRLAARDQAREARARVAKGEISRDQYREERRALRAQARIEREDQQQGRREAQIARRLDLQARRAARAADREAKKGAVAARDPFLPEATQGAGAVAAQGRGSAVPTADRIGEPGETGEPGRVAVVPETKEVGGVAPAVQSPALVEVSRAASVPAAPPEGHGLEVRRWVPAGAPAVRIQILQWSRDDARRFAFISVDGGRATKVGEGTVVGPLSIKTIYREMIEIEFAEKSFLLRAN
jgi:hypothetical protein